MEEQEALHGSLHVWLAHHNAEKKIWISNRVTNLEMIDEMSLHKVSESGSFFLLDYWELVPPNAAHCTRQSRMGRLPHTGRMIIRQRLVLSSFPETKIIGGDGLWRLFFRFDQFLFPKLEMPIGIQSLWFSGGRSNLDKIGICWDSAMRNKHDINDSSIL